MGAVEEIFIELYECSLNFRGVSIMFCNANSSSAECKKVVNDIFGEI